MSKSIILALALLGLSQVAGGSAKAEVYYPWCAWYDDYTYNCGFTSQVQCKGNISGMGGVCRPNMLVPPVVRSAPVSAPIAAAPRPQPQRR
jgi:hypothetical protein